MKKLNILVILFCLLTVNSFCFGQETEHLSNEKGVATLGFGLGLSYGGIGARASVNVIDKLNAFAGLGYQVVGVGYNLGLTYILESSKRSDFYALGMYGTNAATVVDGIDTYDRLYSGPSLGLGLKVNSLKKEGNYLDLGFLVPIKSSEFEDTVDAMKADPLLEGVTRPSPIQIFIGYNFKL